MGYKALYVRNEHMHELTDEKLRGLIIEETGAEQDSRVVTLVVSCIKAIKKYAKPATEPAEEPNPAMDFREFQESGMPSAFGGTTAAWTGPVTA
jgi:hypothetical protein